MALVVVEKNSAGSVKMLNCSLATALEQTGLGQDLGQDHYNSQRI